MTTLEAKNKTSDRLKCLGMNTEELNELCSSITDCPHSTPVWTETGNIVIRNQYIKDGRLDLSNLSFTDNIHFNERRKRAVPCAGDIIITREAPMGDVCMIPDGLECCLGQRMVLLKPNNAKCDNYYLLYALMSSFVQHQISWSDGTGTTVSNLRIPHLEHLKIPYMPVDEQKRIASILSALDDKIVNNKAINHHLEQMAQAFFQRVIIEKSFDQPLGILSDIAYINPQRTLKKGDEAVYVEMANLPTSGSFPVNWENRQYSGGMKFKNGDTILARITPCLENGKTAYINFLDDDAVAFGSTEYIVLSAKPGYCNEMFYFLARNPEFVSYAVGNMNGSSGRQRVSGEAIGQFEIHIPLSESVKEFSTIAIPVMDSIRQNSLENRRLAEIRDALLPRLMSGELSVADV
jgi:type I restriction enzyme S subunit